MPHPHKDFEAFYYSYIAVLHRLTPNKLYFLYIKIIVLQWLHIYCGRYILKNNLQKVKYVK